jgi:hypothetical protein
MLVDAGRDRSFERFKLPCRRYHGAHGLLSLHKKEPPRIGEAALLFDETRSLQQWRT